MAENSEFFGDQVRQGDGSWFLQKPSRVSDSFPVSSEVIARIFDLGQDQFDFGINSRQLVNGACEKIEAENVRAPVCRFAGKCAAGVMLSYNLRGEPLDQDGNPNVSLTVSIGCDKAMTRKNQSPNGPVPMAVTDVRGKLYEGNRQFDDGCYQQMSDQMTRLASFMLEELENRESHALTEE